MRCRMMEKTDRLGRAPEMVASASTMHTEKPASSTDTSLRVQTHASQQQCSLLCLMETWQHFWCIADLWQAYLDDV